MSRSTADVSTQNGSRYLQQLCKHWSHKLDVEFTPETGTVRFPAATVTMSALPRHLTVAVEAASDDDLLRMQDVVARHLDRFAFREAPLRFEWQQAA